MKNYIRILCQRESVKKLLRVFIHRYKMELNEREKSKMKEINDSTSDFHALKFPAWPSENPGQVHVSKRKREDLDDLVKNNPTTSGGNSSYNNSSERGKFSKVA